MIFRKNRREWVTLTQVSILKPIVIAVERHSFPGFRSVYYGYLYMLRRTASWWGPGPSADGRPFTRRPLSFCHRQEISSALSHVFVPTRMTGTFAERANCSSSRCGIWSGCWNPSMMTARTNLRLTMPWALLIMTRSSVFFWSTV